MTTKFTPTTAHCQHLSPPPFSNVQHCCYQTKGLGNFSTTYTKLHEKTRLHSTSHYETPEQAEYSRKNRLHAFRLRITDHKPLNYQTALLICMKGLEVRRQHAATHKVHIWLSDTMCTNMPFKAPPAKTWQDSQPICWNWLAETPWAGESYSSPARIVYWLVKAVLGVLQLAQAHLWLT